MSKYLITLIIGTFVYATLPTAVYAEEIQNSTIQNQEDQAQLEALRRGSYRSPAGSFTGGNRTGGGYNAGTRAPASDAARNPRVQPVPQVPINRWGSFLGGAAAGALIGHFFNPFGGFGYGGGFGGGGFSLISFLIWAVIIYLGFKFFQKIFRRRL